jgi:hypothetical protein
MSNAIDRHRFSLSTRFSGVYALSRLASEEKVPQMKHVWIAAIPLALSALSFAIPAQAQDYRKLSTQWQGKERPLDIVNGGRHNNMAHLADADDVSGQSWRLRKDGSSYRLTTAFRGDGMCLDVTNGGSLNNFVSLQPCGNYSGQFWRMHKDGQWFRLTTEFRGRNMCLDIVNGGAQDGMAQLTPCGNFSGQLWRLD